MRILVLMLVAGSAVFGQLPDIYTQEVHGDPPFLWQNGWRSLLNGHDLDGWHAVGESRHEWVTAKAVTWKRIFDPKRLTFTTAPGDRIVNGKEGRTLYLATNENLGDCELYLEFMLAQGSNSGVFLNGLYELQLFDSFGYSGGLQPGDNGAIYRLEDNTGGWPPRTNASRPPGTWQSRVRTSSRRRRMPNPSRIRRRRRPRSGSPAHARRPPQRPWRRHARHAGRRPRRRAPALGSARGRR